MCNCYYYDRAVHISVAVDMCTLLDRKNFSSSSNGQAAAHRATGLIMKAAFFPFFPPFFFVFFCCWEFPSTAAIHKYGDDRRRWQQPGLRTSYLIDLHFRELHLKRVRIEVVVKTVEVLSDLRVTTLRATLLTPLHDLQEVTRGHVRPLVNDRVKNK